MLDGAIKDWKGVDNVFRFVKFVFETGVKFEANLKEKFDSVMARSRLRKSRDSLFRVLPFSPPIILTATI
jgi:hypothetical protein